jgi:SanA protein
MGMKPTRRRVLIGLGLLAIAAAAGITLCDRWVAWSTSSRIYDSVEAVPSRDVALVLGARPVMPDGQSNLFFTHRMNTAAELWKSGKAKHLLLSGDNGTKTYDETTAMKAALLDRGVPESAITMDYAGFRTLDSVVRARLVFGQTKLIVVSQAFHDERALFIADHRGVDAVALAAADVGSAEGASVRIREVMARVKAVLDVWVLGTRAKFEGPAEPIGTELIERGSRSP